MTKLEFDMNSIAQKIEEKIKSFDRGTIFFADAFLDIGSSEAVRQTLLRLTNNGLIIRVAQGIYCYPEIDEVLGLGVIYPTDEQIANILAERSHSKIVPTGDYALNVLGLSTQVPMNSVFLTNGKSRKISVFGNRQITFKNTAPRNLAFTNRLAMLINSALKSIKNDNVTSEQIAQIAHLLRNEKKDDVLADLKLMPVWIRKIITSAYE